MATATSNGASPPNRLTSLFQHTEPSDGQLLSAFIDHRDGNAFAALVGRHGPMVWGVCRRMLTAHDAEDAFQATFLVLVRKAATVSPRDMVGNWLYGVARQTALQSRRASARRSAREANVARANDSVVTDHDWRRDMEPILDEELCHFPDQYRAVIVLCDLEGFTRKETASRLGIPEGSVASRLARARAMLAKRLSKRGVAVSSAALAAALPQTAKAGVPPWLAMETVDAAAAFATGRSMVGLATAKAVPLAEGVLKVMLVKKLKLAMFVLTASVVLGGVGAGGLLAQAPAGQDVAAKRKPTPTAPKANAPAADGKPKGSETHSRSADGAAEAMTKPNGVETPKTAAADSLPRPDGVEGALVGGGGVDARFEEAPNAGTPAGGDVAFPITGSPPAENVLPKTLHKANPFGGPSTPGDMAMPVATDRSPSMAADPSASQSKGGGSNVLTPEQIFREGYVGSATVNLAVQGVSLGGDTFSMEEATSRQVAQAADGKRYVSRFRIVVAKPVEARLRQLGVEDPQKHFYGKTVRVAGNVKQEVVAGDNGSRLVTYTLTVERLDQLQSVGKGDFRGGLPGTEGGGMGPGGFNVPMGARR